MDLSQLLQDVPIHHMTGGPAGDVLSVCYDSRRCQKDSLFVAIAGMKADGHAFIGEAIRGGARVIVHQETFNPPPGITSIRVGDSRRILGILGRNLYRHPSAEICLVGVIGTNGKTTVTYLLESIFREAGYSAGVLGTVNYRFDGRILPAPNTTPESLDMQEILREMADREVSHVIAEVSSHSVDLRRVDDCDFDLGIFTNLSQDHLDYHKNMENYYAAKRRFFAEILPGSKKDRPVKMAVNGDDPWGQRLLREVSLRAFTFGMETFCDVMVEDSDLSLQGIVAKIRTPKGSMRISSPFIGRFNLYNILAAVAVALALGISERHIQGGITRLGNVPGRLEKVSAAGQPTVFVDYAHTDDALWRVLQNLSAFKKGRMITVFGCGGDRDRGKRPLMGQAATTFSDLTVLTSDNPRSEDPMSIIEAIETGISQGAVRKINPSDMDSLSMSGASPVYVVIPDRREAIERAIAMADQADLVLIAGKGHEDYQIIGDRRFPFDDRSIARGILNTTDSGAVAGPGDVTGDVRT